MAPPDRGDTPHRGDSQKALRDVGLHAGSGSRLSPTANVLASWVEWLLHPEEHDYDRTVITKTGRDVRSPVELPEPTRCLDKQI
jgi:hypothetical protein